MASHIPRITVLGSLNIDLVSYVPHHPLPGETLTSTSFAVSPGGKGANQAVACAKLSRSSRGSSGHTAAGNDQTATAHVRMVGNVGSDSYGALLVDNLRAHGVDASGVAVRDGLKTGIAIIVVDEPTGQNRIILSPEANHFVGPDGGRSALDDALGLGGSGAARPDLLVLQLEIPLPTVLAALKAAKQAHIPVLLNPAPAQSLGKELLAGLAHLVLNETEAAVLSGRAESELEDDAGVEGVARGFVEKGVENVVITLGGRGAFYMAASGEKGLVPAEKAKVVDTTAAGDTFVGQYALEVVSGEAFRIEPAVRKATRAAAKTVERMGAQDSIPWRDEL